MAEIHIEATETDPAVQAQAVVHKEHERLRAGLAALAGAKEPSHTALAEFATGDLRRYLEAVDETLLAAAPIGAPRGARGGTAASHGLARLHPPRSGGLPEPRSAHNLVWMTRVARSTISSILESGSTTERLTLRAWTMFPSLPQSPIAFPPAALM